MIKIGKTIKSYQFMKMYVFLSQSELFVLLGEGVGAGGEHYSGPAIIANRTVH